MIIDCHAHIASPRYLPEAFFGGWVENIKALAPSVHDNQEQLLVGLFDSLNDDPLCDQYVAQMDEAGIDKSVLLIIDFKYVYGEPFEDLFQIFLEHRAVLDRHMGRFVCFAGVDPRRGAEGLDLFEKGIRELGFKGLKLYPPCGFSPSDERLDPYYEVCRKYAIPVLTHVGPTTPALSFRDALPMAVDSAAQRFPDVKFILGHAGSMFSQEASMLAQYRPNVYLDMSGYQSAVHRGHFEKLMRWHKETGIVNKLLFGTDWPIHRMHGAQTKWLGAFNTLRDDGVLTNEELQNVLAGNFVRASALEPDKLA